MKVQVSIEFVSDSKLAAQNTTSTLNLAVKPFDSVQSLKQRIGLVEPIPFPEQELKLDKKTLNDDDRFGDLGIQEGQALRLIVRASEGTLLGQLRELLKARPLSISELGLLYCHQHGATPSQALKALNCDEQLADFIYRQKCFITQDGGLISLSEVKEPEVEKSLSSIREGKYEYQAEKEVEDLSVTVRVTVKTQSGNIDRGEVSLKVAPVQTVQSLCERALATELVPFTAQAVLLQGQKAVELAKAAGDAGIREGEVLNLEVEASQEALKAQLAAILKDRDLSVVELGDHYCYRYGAPASRALKLLGLRGQLKEFLKAHADCFSIESGLVSLKQEAVDFVAKESACSLNKRYLDVHSQITSTDKIPEASRALDLAIKAASEGSFLSVSRAVRGGSVGRGTAIDGSVDAQALLLLSGMPPVGREVWLPPLLTALSTFLRQELAGKAEDIFVKGDSVFVRFQGCISVELSMDAVAGPLALESERRARFFNKQPMPSKITMRLLKWWSNQQSWKDASSCPPDLILELLVAHAEATHTPAAQDQTQAVERVLSLAADFEQTQATWPGEFKNYLKDVAEVFDHRQLAMLAANSKGSILG